MQYVDIPTPAEIKTLASKRHDASVSIFLRTTPVTEQAQQDRIKLSNLVHDALRQLEENKAPKRSIGDLEAAFADLIDDDDYWARQSESLAIFATPGSLRPFRLPNHLEDRVSVSDRFHLPPLLRAVAFPHTAVVLVLAQNAVRVIEMAGDRPVGVVRVPDMPRDAASVARKANIADRSPKGRLQGSEGQKVRLVAYSRRVDAALRPLLAGGETPLALVASEPVRSIFLSVCSYDHVLRGHPEGVSEQSADQEIASAVRLLLDAHYAGVTKEMREHYLRASGRRRGTSKISDIARSATFGGVESLMLDMDASVSGRIDAETGEIAYADHEGADSYDLLSEIASRVISTGGRVASVRAEDLPDDQPIAAILRHPV